MAQSLRLKGKRAWQAWCRHSGARPANVPVNPDYSYKSMGWQGWGDFLGTGSLSTAEVRRQFLSFKDARDFVTTLELGSQKEWSEWSKACPRPSNIPAHPQETYRQDGWQGWPHWLGTRTSRIMPQQTFLPFEEAADFVQSLNLRSWQAWRHFAKSDAR